MKKWIFSFLVLSLQAEAQFAESYQVKNKATVRKTVFTAPSFFVGHSLTQTSYTLPKGEWMLGSFALGYGLTDQVTIGTSPWLLGLYNMPNLILRAYEPLGPSTALGLQAGYMKTQNYLRDFYDMETYYGNLILSHIWSSRVRTHMQANFMYFINDKEPFSIRVSNPTKPEQISLSILNELSFYKDFKEEVGVGLELGSIGFNDQTPFLHAGFSLFRKTKNLLIQVGVSISATTNIRPADFKYVGSSQALPDNGDYAFRQIVTHPELQVQYYF